MANVLSLWLLFAVFAVTRGVQADSASLPLLGSGNISVASADQAPSNRAICLRARLSGEGIECPAVRGDSGELYTLAGDTGGFEVGDKVCVCGTASEVSFCMQGTTIAVTYISSDEEDCPPQAP